MIVNGIMQRALHTSVRRNYKVAVLGAAGGIGQPLSLLLKAQSKITELALYDIQHAKGVAADLSHINTPAKVTGYVGDAELAAALKDAHIAIIPAGVPRKPGMTRDDLFNINAGIVMNLAKACATHCPKAFIAIISNPVNSTVPIAAEVFKKLNVYDPKRIFGVTTLDSLRASTFIAEAANVDPSTVIPVVGGHSGPTIVPLLSQTNIKLSSSDVDAYVKRVQYGGDEVVKAKNGGGSATLSMASAGARFTEALISGLEGKTGKKEPAFIESSAVPEVKYFATFLEFDRDGVKKVHPMGNINEHEKNLMKECIPELQKNISKGETFVKDNFK